MLKLSRTFVLISAWTTVVLSVVIAVVHHVGLVSADLAAMGFGGWLACAAFAAPLGGVGILALAGVYTKQPVLWITSGVALAIGSFLSPLALPLLVPAVIMICTESDSLTLRFPAFLAAALAALFTFVVFTEGATPIFGGGDTVPLPDTSAMFVIAATAAVAVCGFAWGVWANADAEFDDLTPAA